MKRRGRIAIRSGSGKQVGMATGSLGNALRKRLAVFRLPRRVRCFRGPPGLGPLLAAVTVSLTFAAPPGNAGAGERSITIALVGDSTVTAHSGWGGAFAERFDDGVRVHNFAVSGHSSRSWYEENRLRGVLQAGPDYVLIQFGHNDMRDEIAEPGRDPTAEYRDYLREYVRAFRDAGAKPILLSPVTRRTFNRRGRIESELAPWAEAARAVAREMEVPFIDLHGASVKLHNDLGPRASMTFNPRKGDVTHFNDRGGRAIATLVLQQLVSRVGELAGHVD